MDVTFPETNSTTDEITRLKRRCEELESDNLGLLSDLEDVLIRASYQEKEIDRLRDAERSIQFMKQQKESAEYRVAALELKLCCLRFEYEQKLADLEKRLGIID